MMVFVTGGVRSGKSSWAERFCIERAKQKMSPVHYVATSAIVDSEMEQRILLHQKRREQSGIEWKTIEQQQHIREVTAHLTGDEIVLIDCLTNLVNNEMFADMRTYEQIEYQDELIRSIAKELHEIDQASDTLVIVSNELAFDTNRFPMVHSFIRVLNKLHQHLVHHSTLSVMMEAGIPIWKKGVWHERIDDSRDGF